MLDRFMAYLRRRVFHHELRKESGVSLALQSSSLNQLVQRSERMAPLKITRHQASQEFEKAKQASGEGSELQHVRAQNNPEISTPSHMKRPLKASPWETMALQLNRQAGGICHTVTTFGSHRSRSGGQARRALTSKRTTMVDTGSKLRQIGK